MDLKRFFSLVLPSGGFFCCAKIGPRGIDPKFSEDITQILAWATNTAAKENVYYTPFSMLDDSTRNQDNAKSTRAFWLDIDVGKANKSKSYDSYAEAETAVSNFIRDSGLPDPLWVDSGMGIHLYWVVDIDISPGLWLPVAKALQAMAHDQGLKIDTGVTTDSARLMRVPYTTNYPKDGSDPVQASIRNEDYTPLDFVSFIDLFDIEEQEDAEDADDLGDLGFEVPEHLKDYVPPEFDNQRTSFKKILEHDPPCAQVVHMVTNRTSLEEPMWRGALSIAQVCEDRDKAIEAVSEDHPDYTFAKASKKAGQTNGPYTCATLEGLNPAGCDGCPHKGKISTPVQLGTYVPESETEEDRVVQIPLNGSKDDTQAFARFVIPEYPEPYFRPKGKPGVWRYNKGTDEDGEAKRPTLVCEYDFYVIRRVRDPEVGEVLWFRVHFPQDGVHEFSMPLTDVAAKERLRDTCAKNGLLFSDTKHITECFHYVQSWLRSLQMDRQAEKVRMQMGWTDDDSFVLGTREFLYGYPVGQDIEYAPPAQRNIHIVDALSEKGSMDRWKEIVQFYNQPGMEPFAFTLFLSMGSPLMHFTNLKGGVLNLMSPESGVGKSSALMAANSVWGHPVDLMLQVDDTPNARWHRAGVMQNLPITIDEITNMKALQLSDQVYASASGRGKNRMMSQTNAERQNFTSWKAPTITTSNSSIYEKLQSAKDFPEGELMRVLEVRVERVADIPKGYTDVLFAGLEHNYGLAGASLIRHYQAYRDETVAHLAHTQAQIDANAKLTQRERIWSVLSAIAITGGSIAKQLGLHNISVEAVSDWARQLLVDSVEKVDLLTNSPEETVALYIAEFYNNRLIINGASPANSSMPVSPIQEPRGDLRIRFEPDTRNLFIVSTPFKRWCAEKQLHFGTFMGDMRKRGVKVEMIKKRMGKGTHLDVGPVSAIRLELPKSWDDGYVKEIVKD